VQVLGAEDHRAQHAQVVRQPTHRLPAQRQLLLPRRPVHLDVLGALGDDGAADEVAGLAVADELGAAHAAEGAQGGQEVDGLKDVRLALRVVPQQYVEAGRDVHVEPRVVAKVAEA
jgi:hypothetical protein